MVATTTGDGVCHDDAAHPPSRKSPGGSSPGGSDGAGMSAATPRGQHASEQRRMADAESASRSQHGSSDAKDDGGGATNLYSPGPNSRPSPTSPVPSKGEAKASGGSNGAGADGAGGGQFKRQADLAPLGGAGAGAPPKRLGKLSGASALPSLGSGNGATFGGAALPSLDDLQAAMHTRRRAAEEAFARNQELLREQQTQQDRLLEQAGVSKDDMAQRARHLKEQRDRIVKKKTEEREAKARTTRSVIG